MFTLRLLLNSGRDFLPVPASEKGLGILRELGNDCLKVCSGAIGVVNAQTFVEWRFISTDYATNPVVPLAKRVFRKKKRASAGTSDCFTASVAVT